MVKWQTLFILLDSIFLGFIATRATTPTGEAVATWVSGAAFGAAALMLLVDQQDGKKWAEK